MRKHYAIGLSLLLLSIFTYAQDITVTGKVTDSQDGLELPGVTVQVKGTDGGTITDFEGKYSIEVAPDAILIFNYLGYQPQEIQVGSQTTIDVALETETEVLEEVVVIGYGVVEKGDVTGVIKKIDEEQFNTGVIASPDQLLTGKVAGVNIQQNDGQPGGNSRVRIRGGTSLTASNEPLYVIDGVPVDNTPHEPGGRPARNPLNFLNPSEIADITVLKDASATAIYGSRAANGVIIITTKGGMGRKGEADDKPTITYDGNVGISSFPGETPVLTPEEYRAAISAFDPDNAENPVVVGPANTIWFDEVTQVAKTQTHNISVGANVKDGNYRFSSGFQEINGIVKGSSNERFNINFNFNKGLLDNSLSFRFSTKNSITNDKFASNQIGSALAFNPTQPIYLDSSLYQGIGGVPAELQGQFGGYTEYSDPLAVRNPVAENSQQKQTGNGFRNLSNFDVKYNIPFVDGLSVRNNISFDYRTNKRVAFSPSFLKSQQTDQGYYYSESERNQSLLYEAILEYARDLDAIDGKFSILGGYSYQTFYREYPRFEHDSLFTNAFGLNAPAPIPNSNIVIASPIFENRLISFYGRINLEMKDKYLITTTLRRDGSTKFSDDTRWGLFPSVALGWRVSNEEFYEPLKEVVNYLKLRFGYGINGNQDIDDYLYLSTYGFSNANAFYQLGGTYYPTLRPEPIDPSIKWEETSSLNLGIDWEILKGKVAGNIEFYQKNTKDLLYEVAVPVGILPGDRVVTNIGEVRNRGIEIEITAPVLSTKEYRWEISANAAYNRNEILNLDNTVSSAENTIYNIGNISGDVGQTIQALQVGFPNESFYVYEHLYDGNGAPIYDLNNLTSMYKDQNGDGTINENDLVFKEKAAPDWILGLTSVSYYKGFDMTLTLRAQIGGFVYNNFSSNYGELQRLENAVPQNIHKSALETRFERKQLLSDYYLENATFIRLDNVQVGYTINQFDWIRTRVYIGAQNLWKYDKYSGFDPEIPDGIDNNLYPRARTFIGGLTLTF